MPRNGSIVSEFEKAFADYVGARFAIALSNGTATLHTALVALGVKPGDKVAVPPLTMSATSLAVLQAGAVPVFVDVDPKTWLMTAGVDGCDVVMPVSLYGLHHPCGFGFPFVDDAAQTLRPYGNSDFTSYSFQASKILALGEGGMLATNDEDLATRAREFSSLGYRMRAGQPRIDPAVIKSPDYERHHWPLAFNYRMNDLTALEGVIALRNGNQRAYLARRRRSADLYREAIEGCDWITPQYTPEGWTHDYWCYAIALKDKSLWKPFTEAVVRHGGEMPYGAWRLTYHEPAFRHFTPRPANQARLIPGSIDFPACPVAEDLQPRLVQGQTNSLESAERNAKAWKRAIEDVSLQADRLDRFPDATGIPCE
jgi:perosamine synthetase